MKVLLYFGAIFIAVCHLCISVDSKMICHYDTTSASREGPSKFTSEDMKQALQFCTHIIYSYASITPKTFAVTTLTRQREQEFAKIQQLKQKYPNVKFLLSISGDKNWQSTENFLELLEGGHKAQQQFVTSALNILRKFEFDGLSLDFPLPTERPTKVLSYGSKLWEDVKNFFTGNSVVDSKAKEHKAQFTDLVLQLSTSLKENNQLLSLAVLPNVNSKWYFDAAVITKHLDFVILCAFDFYTPERNPEEADYMAPIEFHINRLPQTNVNYQVQQWLSQKTPPNKIIVGVATWGRSWKITTESKNTGLPPVFLTEGAASAGPQTLTSGFLSWPEICEKFSSNKNKTGEEVGLRRIVDPTKKYGNYAYRPADTNGDNGIWISYEEPSTAAFKAEYVKDLNLGGVALYDLSLDDVHGVCTGDKFPILRSIQFKLLQ